MIIVIRRWLKSGGFQVILWVILAIMAIIFLMPSIPQFGRRTANTIVTVNGQDLTDEMISRKAAAIEDQMQQARQQWGQYADMMFKMMGLKANPRETAFEQVVQEALIDQVAQKLGLEVHNDFIRDKLRDPNFLQSISDLIPPYAFDASGINEQALNVHLQRFGLSTSDFNEELAKAIKRNVVTELASATGYIPSFELKEQMIAQNAPKQFSYIKIDLDKLYQEEKQKEISKEELVRFFERENATSKRYLVPEKRSGLIWKFEPKDYGVEISKEEIEEYYNAHKVRLYSDKPAEIQVRRILFKVPDQAQLSTIVERARAVRSELLENPDQFGKKAQELSEDTETAKKGGLMEPFTRGTHNVEFEKAAFLLKEDGDIAHVVQTDKGVEIVQRVSKKAPTYKPLSSVSKEIKEKLELRSFKEQFLQDMKELLEDGEVTQEELQEFIKKRGGASEKVGSLEKDKSKLAQKLFGLEKDGVGFYIEGAIGVAVQLTDIQKKYTPELKTIEKNVTDNLYRDRAAKRLNKELNELRAKVASTPLNEVAKTVGASFKKTDWLAAADTDKLEELKKQGIPVDMMMQLEKAGTALTHQDDEHGYLIYLDAIKPLEEATIKEKQPEAASRLRWTQFNLIGTGFVASLYRNAIIKTSETLPFSTEDNAV